MKRFMCLLAIVAAGVTVAAQYPDGHWQNFAPYPQPTQEVGAAVVNGKLYILGGYGANAPGGLAGWLNEYDPTADKWTKKTDIPMPVHHEAITAYKDKFYTFGGGVKISLVEVRSTMSPGA
jgi:N-acetylneuraminic acid mutarotase